MKTKKCNKMLEQIINIAKFAQERQPETWEIYSISHLAEQLMKELRAEAVVWDKKLKNDDKETLEPIVGDGEGWSKWVVCQKGHSSYPDVMKESVKDWKCPKCSLGKFDWGLIDDRDLMFETKRFHPAQLQAREKWLEKHPDDTEIIQFREGNIITHKVCGGLGVVCTCPEGEWEPAEFYVKWVIVPDWSKSDRERSIWLGHRQDSFALAKPVDFSEVIKKDG
jgi:hypothetical protein